MVIKSIRPNPARRSLRLRLRPLSRRPEVPHRPIREQAREYHNADSTRGLRVQRRGLLRARCPKPSGGDVVRVGPERLGVREEGVEPRDERRAPEVGRRPAVGEELGGRGEGEGVWVEEGEEVRQEEAAIRGELSIGMYIMSMGGQFVVKGEENVRQK